MECRSGRYAVWVISASGDPDRVAMSLVRINDEKEQQSLPGEQG